MPVIEEGIVIERPRQEVFDFFLDPDKVVVYSSNMIEYQLIAGDRHAVGRRDRGAVRVAGRRLDFTSELIEIEPGQRLLLQSQDAKIPFTMELRFTGEGQATTVSWRQETDPLGGFFGRLGDAVVVKMYARDVKSNLEQAKTLLES